MRQRAQENRTQLELLAAELNREAHIVHREPGEFSSHLHNVLLLDEGRDGAVGELLAKVRMALADRCWLCLTNRPPARRSGLVRTLDHGDEVVDIAWMDGQRLIGSVGRYSVRLWRPVSGWPVVHISADSVDATASSPDRGLMAWGDERGRVWIYDVLTGAGPRALGGGHGERINALAFSPDGRLLASGGHDKAVRLWDVEGGSEAAVVRGPSVPTALVFSPGGDALAWDTAGRVRLWDIAREQERASLEGVLGDAGFGNLSWGSALAFSPNGQILAGGGFGGVRVWELGGESRARVWEPDEPGRGITAVAFSPDGATLVSGENTHPPSVRLWDVESGSQSATLRGHVWGVREVTFSPDGQLIASADEKGEVRLWDVGGRSPAATLRHTAGVHALTFAPDGTRLASGSRDETIRLWDPERCGVTGREARHTNTVRAAAFSPDNVGYASASDDGTVRLWNGITGEPGLVLQRHEGAVQAVAWSPDGSIVASGGDDQVVQLWNAATGDAGQTLNGHTDRVLALACSPDGAWLASGGADKTVCLWDLNRDGQPTVFDGYTEWVTALAFSSDGHHLASGGSLQKARIIDVERATARDLLPGEPKAFKNTTFASATFSPDNQMLALTGRGIQLWDIQRGTQRCSVIGGEERVAFSSDGVWLVSAGGTKVSLWNLGTLTRATPDGRNLFLDDDGARIWANSGRALVAVARFLSPILALRFDENSHSFVVADNGAATGDRPIFYSLDLSNIEHGKAPLEPAGVDA